MRTLPCPSRCRSTIWCFVLLAVCAGAQAAEVGGRTTFSSVDMAPLSALQLGDAALVAPEVLEGLGAETGQPAELSVGERRVEVRLFPLDRPAGLISMKKDIRDCLGITPGDVEVSLRILSPDEQTLQPVEKEVRIEAHPGSPAHWPGLVLGAPHGDCDLYTGEIVQLVTDTYGVPSVCAYGSRITFLGRWIDVNRPLQRRPNPDSFGILPYRDWTDEAERIFTEYRGKVLTVGHRPDAAEGDLPLRLYFDFHGHDLTVKGDDGKGIYRNVFECMARGFSLEEVRQLKAAFDRRVAEEYGDDAPASYWGNLPEDRHYRFAGLPADFFYSGLGARVYGALASDVANRGIHIESPNSMRIQPSVRRRTAKVLAGFLQDIRDEILPASLARQTVPPPAPAGEPPIEWATVPAGPFLMGAPKGEGWSIEWPQHWIELSAYQISTTEVTCGQYAGFVNRALKGGLAELRGSTVAGKVDGRVWCVLWPEGPLAMLEQEGDHITWRKGRRQHPVNYVTWHGAMAMAESNDATLPTEAQWEKAAGWDAQTRRPLRTGLSLPNFGPTVEAAMMHSGNASEDYIAPSTCPVGSFPGCMSPIGCYDMSGNVWEWTADWLAGYEETTDPLRDPTGPEGGTMRAVRGGAWDCERCTATPSFRLGVSPDRALPSLGFRLARPVAE